MWSQVDTSWSSALFDLFLRHSKTRELALYCESDDSTPIQHALSPSVLQRIHRLSLNTMALVRSNILEMTIQASSNHLRSLDIHSQICGLSVEDWDGKCSEDSFPSILEAAIDRSMEKPLTTYVFLDMELPSLQQLSAQGVMIVLPGRVPFPNIRRLRLSSAALKLSHGEDVDWSLYKVLRELRDLEHLEVWANCGGSRGLPTTLPTVKSMTIGHMNSFDSLAYQWLQISPTTDITQVALRRGFGMELRLVPPSFNILTVRAVHDPKWCGLDMILSSTSEYCNPVVRPTTLQCACTCFRRRLSAELHSDDSSYPHLSPRTERDLEYNANHLIRSAASVLRRYLPHLTAVRVLPMQYVEKYSIARLMDHVLPASPWVRRVETHGLDAAKAFLTFISKHPTWQTVEWDRFSDFPGSVPVTLTMDEIQVS